MIKVGFELEVDEGVFAPSSAVVVQGLSEALPKEWWAVHREGTWGVKALFALNDDGTLQQSDHRLCPKDLRWENKMLTAELDQERKLTTHLERKIKNLETDAVEGKEQVRNLIEKNDNQRVVINRQGDANADLNVQINRLTEKVGKNLIDYKTLEVKYDDSLLDWKIVTKERDRAYNDVDRLNDDLKSCQAANRTNLGEAKVNEEMVQKIVDAMEGAGYDISGWGNDADLEELERRAADIENATNTISTASGQLCDASLDLDAKLDNIRTER